MQWEMAWKMKTKKQTRFQYINFLTGIFHGISHGIFHGSSCSFHEVKNMTSVLWNLDFPEKHDFCGKNLLAEKMA